MNATHDVAPFLADHLALDFLNTRYMTAAGAIDTIDEAPKLAAWLNAARRTHPDAFAAGYASNVTPATVARALALREWLRARLAQGARQARNADGDFALLNRVLASGARQREVVAEKNRLALHETVRADGPDAPLLPIAEAIAALLCEGDLARVRKCGNDACVLWFYDRTKSGRRRWCSMAVCGNQAKVKAFRRRERARAGRRRSKANG